MKLYVVRHGDALTADTDATRPHSQKGISDAQKMAAFLKSSAVKVDCVYQSGLKRAEQTAEILAKELKLGCPVEQKDHLKPDDDVDLFIQSIRNETGDLMIVGHLPHLSHLVSKLVINSLDPQIIEFKKGAVVLLEKESDRFFRIKWFVVPKLL